MPTLRLQLQHWSHKQSSKLHSRRGIHHMILRRNHNQHPSLHLTRSRTQSRSMPHIMRHHRLQLTNPIIRLKPRRRLLRITQILRKLRPRSLLHPILRSSQSKAVNQSRSLQCRSLGIIPAIPILVLFNAAQLRIPKQQIRRSLRRSTNDRHSAIHKIGIRNSPFESLHATHRNTHHSRKVRQLQMLCRQLMLRADHISNREFRKPLPRLIRTIGRRCSNPITQGIHSNHEKPRGIRKLTRTDQRLQLLAGSGKPSRKNHSVRPRRIQSPECPIRDLAIPDHLAAIESKISE